MPHKFNIEDKLNFFLSLYFYELEVILNDKANEISFVKFQSEESNTDEYLKEYIKQIIQQNNNVKGEKIKKINLIYGSKSKVLNVNEFDKFHITNILTPKELTSDLKKKIGETKSSVYTNPDLLLEIKGYNQTFYESIELKSTKNNKIPGSSVQQVNPFEWVIFIKRKDKNIQVSTGLYINSITKKLPFPDRSPRPQIGFNTLVDWNKQNRILNNQKFTYSFDHQLNEKKLKILSNWQEYLAEEWMTLIKADTKLKNEKWFNSTLRKFALKFLDYSEGLGKKELEALRNRLEELNKIQNHGSHNQA